MADRYWIGGSGDWTDGVNHWSDTSGGSGDADFVPTSSDNVIFDLNSNLIGATITLPSEASCLSFTSISGANYTIYSENFYGISCYGSSISLESGITWQDVILYLMSPTTTSIETFGSIVDINMGGGGVYTLQDNLYCSYFQFDSGTFDANNFNVTSPSYWFNINSSNNHVYMGSGIWEVTGNFIDNFDVWTIDETDPHELILHAETSTLKFTDTTEYPKMMSGFTAGKTYNNVWFSGNGTGEFFIQGSNTFNQLKIDTPPHIIKFEVGKTQNINELVVSGTVSDPIVLCQYNPDRWEANEFPEYFPWLRFDTPDAGATREIVDGKYHFLDDSSSSGYKELSTTYVEFTAEIRIKITQSVTLASESSASSFSIQQVPSYNSQGFYFYSDGIRMIWRDVSDVYTEEDYPMDTSDYHTYKVSSNGVTAKFYVDGVLIKTTLISSSSGNYGYISLSENEGSGTSEIYIDHMYCSEGYEYDFVDEQQFTLNNTSSGAISVDHLNIINSNATGNYWFAGLNSIDGGNNDGWIFDVPATQIIAYQASRVNVYSAILTGEILKIYGNATERGFEIRTEFGEYENIYTQTGDFGVGSFSTKLLNLNRGTTYYYRAYAINVTSTEYSSELSFTTLAPDYSITIGGVDRTLDIINQSIIVDDTINDKINTCKFELINRSGSATISAGDEVRITTEHGVIFGGYIVDYELSKKESGVIKTICSCVDYTLDLDRRLVHESYQNMTDREIIIDIVNRYCPEAGINVDNVETGVTLTQISFNYVQVSEAFRRIAKIANRNWYLDYDKYLYYFPLETYTAPFNIDSTNNDYFDLKISQNSNQIKNRVYVRGGTKLSDSTTYSIKGDGVLTKFVLPDKPHEVTVKVNSVEKSLGIKNIDLEGYDWYLNFQEKYIEQDAAGTILNDTDTLEVTYKYDIPILVAVEDKDSIEANGFHEFAIFDKSITTNASARDRATAELTDYADNIVEGSFSTFEHGFSSGQYININLSDYGINADYLVQKVNARSIGGGKYVYTISVASSKTMGIINFLISLLNNDKNVVELDDEEVVDELLEMSDSLLSDSLTDSLTIDSAGPYFTWALDSETSPITIMRWGLFQWG